MADENVTVSVADVSVNLHGSRILERVSFDCRPGEWTLLYGASGSGKSTLLRAINGLVSPSRGRIWTLGTPIPGRSGHEARTVWRQTGTVLQEVALFETKNALENVELALHTVGIDRRLAREQAASWLERLKIGHKVHEYPAHLSGGERQRVALARAMAIQPRLLILDEPTSAVDQATAEIVLLAIKELAGQGTAVVMSSHRLGEVAEHCDQRIAMVQGQITDMERRSGAGDYTLMPRQAWQDNGQHAPDPEANDESRHTPKDEDDSLSMPEQVSIIKRLLRAFQ